MPTTIPYDPSLVLGNIVVPEMLDNLMAIAALQGPVDSAQDTLNSYITMKRSIDMTVQELINMNIDPKDLANKSVEVGRSISKAATEYATTRIEQEAKIQPLRAKIQTVHKSVESPIDYTRTMIKKMPLSADSLKMDAQYFSFDGNEQEAQNKVSSVKRFVSASVQFLGDDIASDIASSASEQINRQRQEHDIEGTLVLTAACTHKEAQLLAPFILDVDKAVRVWNRMFSDEKQKIKIDDLGSMEAIAKEEGTAQEKSISLLSGATYGSSFVGMVHVLRSEKTTTSQRMSAAATSMQLKAEVGAWFSEQRGGFGLDETFADDIKNLLSTQSITSHISLITMGSIPSIKSNVVKLSVKTITEFDPQKMMQNLAALANATQQEKSTLASSATAARTGAQMIALKGGEIKSVLSGLSDIDDGANRMLDINSMMTAFEDYVAKAIAGDVGVPINYYVKEITRAQIAEMWMSKYFPKKYLAISGDDSARLKDSESQGTPSTSESSDSSGSPSTSESSDSSGSSDNN